MKYILFADARGDLHPVFFSDLTIHRDVTVAGMKPVSAGFVNPQTGQPHGESTSLGLKARTEDRELLHWALVNSTAMLMVLNEERRGNTQAPKHPKTQVEFSSTHSAGSVVPGVASAGLLTQEAARLSTPTSAVVNGTPGIFQP